MYGCINSLLSRISNEPCIIVRFGSGTSLNLRLIPYFIYNLYATQQVIVYRDAPRYTTPARW